MEIIIKNSLEMTQRILSFLSDQCDFGDLQLDILKVEILSCRILTTCAVF